MGRVIITAIAGDVLVGENTLLGGELKAVHGVDCQDDFAEYADSPLRDKLDSGYMSFKYDDGKLYTVTEYGTNARLSDEELDELIDYTQGQWSDGIGEGFEQEPCMEIDGEDVFISAWYHGQIAAAVQED